MKPTGKTTVRPLSYRSAEPATAISTDSIRDVQMPLWLLVAGIIIEMGAAYFRSPTLAAGMMSLAVGVGLGTVLMLAGMLIAVKFRGIELGHFWTAVFKLAAISVAPAAAVDLLTPVLNVIPLGGLLGFVIDFILYFALLGALFELDESDTWYCVCVIFVIRVAFYFGLKFMIT